MKKLIGWGALALFVALNGAYLATLTAEVLPSKPASYAMPEAHPPEGMTIAAIETGYMKSMASGAYRGASLTETRDFNMGGILVRHPKGTLLIDAGLGSKAREHFRTMPLLMQLTSTLHEGPSAAQQLQDAGIPLSSIQVVLTHAHWDHVSGVQDLAGVPVLVTQAEADFIKSGDPMASLAASFAGVNWKLYGFTGLPYLGFDGSYDVFEDGSVVIVPAPGHTPGSVIAFVATPDGKRYAFIGDIAWQKEGIDIPAQKPLVSRRLVDKDAEAVKALVVHLHEIQQALPGLLVVPAHDKRVWDTLPQLKS